MTFFTHFIRNLTILASIAGFIAIAYIYRVQSAQEMPKILTPPYPPADKPTLHAISATGIVESLSENVAIAPPIAGLVAEVFVHVNDSVKQGDLLFRLDDTDLKALLLSTTAKKSVAAANLNVAKAQLARKQSQLNRFHSVKDPLALSQDQLETLSHEVLVAEAQIAANQAEIQAIDADLASIDLRLERLKVRAPRNGSIIQLNIRAGEFAATSPKAPAIILGDLQKLQIRADVDEYNAPFVVANAPAYASLKGVPSVKFPLEFVRIEPFIIPKTSLTGASTERVDTRVLQVIYSFPRPASPSIYVGQQVDLFIDRPQN